MVRLWSLTVAAARPLTSCIGFGPYQRPYFRLHLATRRGYVTFLQAEDDCTGRRSVARKPSVRFTAEEDHYILSRREDDASWKSIAEHLGRQISTVHNRHATLQLKNQRPSANRPSSRIFTSIDDRVIIGMANDNAPAYKIVDELSKTMRCTEGQVAHRIWQLRRDGKVKVRQRPLTDQEVARVQSLREAGYKWKEISAMEQRSIWSMHDALTRRKRKESTPASAGRLWTDLEEKELVHLRENDKVSWHEVSRVLGRSTWAVASRYRRLAMSQGVHSPRTFRYTAEEDRRLLRLVQQYGHYWLEIQRLMPHRTPSSLRARYEAHLFRRIGSQADDSGQKDPIEGRMKTR